MSTVATPEKPEEKKMDSELETFIKSLNENISKTVSEGLATLKTELTTEFDNRFKELQEKGLTAKTEKKPEEKKPEESGKEDVAKSLLAGLKDLLESNLKAQKEATDAKISELATKYETVSKSLAGNSGSREEKVEKKQETEDDPNSCFNDSFKKIGVKV